MLRNVLVRLEDSPETEFAVGASLAFAKGYGSTVTGLYVRHVPPMTVMPDVIGMPMGAGSNMQLQMAVDLEFAAAESELQAQALSAFEGAARDSSVSFRCDVRAGNSANAFAERAGRADLVVLPRGEADRGRIGCDVEALVRAVRHPFLVASEAIEAISRIGVAYDGSEGSVQALALAADIVHHWKGDRPELLLIEVLPPDDPPRSVLAAAREYLDLYGLPHRTVTVRGVAGEEIPAIAVREEVDLLCMGAYGHWAVREYLLGSTTQAVIERRRKPILLCH